MVYFTMLTRARTTQCWQ